MGHAVNNFGPAPPTHSLNSTFSVHHENRHDENRQNYVKFQMPNCWLRYCQIKLLSVTLWQQKVCSVLKGKLSSSLPMVMSNWGGLMSWRNLLTFCQTRGSQSTTRVRSNDVGPPPPPPLVVVQLRCEWAINRRLRCRPRKPWTGSWWLSYCRTQYSPTICPVIVCDVTVCSVLWCTLMSSGLGSSDVVAITNALQHAPSQEAMSHDISCKL